MADRIIEIRTYKLRPGSQDEFHRLVHEQSIPLVKAWGHQVVSYGPALDDPDGYVLIRAYDSLEDLHAKQDAFYESDAWKLGPRQAIVSLIESDSNAIFRYTE
jgi:hypothetical protein